MHGRAVGRRDVGAGRRRRRRRDRRRSASADVRRRHARRRRCATSKRLRATSTLPVGVVALTCIVHGPGDRSGRSPSGRDGDAGAGQRDRLDDRRPGRSPPAGRTSTIEAGEPGRRRAHLDAQLVAARPGRGRARRRGRCRWRRVDERLARRRSPASSSSGSLAGVNDSSQPLRPMHDDADQRPRCRTPGAAGRPSAATGRAARARRAWATWRAVSPTNSIAATSTVLSSSTRPWGSLNSEPPSSR